VPFNERLNFRRILGLGERVCLAAAPLLLFAFLAATQALGLSAAGGHGGGGHASGGTATHSSHSSPSGGPVHVSGYTRKDGTYVRAHDRAAPGEGTHSLAGTPSAGHSKGGNETPESIDIRPSRGISTSAPRLLTGGFGRPPSPSGTQARDAKGRFVRSEKAKDDFERAHPCPANGRTSGPCPGYVIDHIVALKRGGPDSPSNMQWQTVADAKAKDKWE
jgi:hypothetical protein